MADLDGSDAPKCVNQGSDSQPGTDEKASTRPNSSTSGHVTTSSSSAADTHSTTRTEPLALKIDERQRLARERREEQEKQTAARELQWLQREERARHYYEKQLEERRRRLEEQRMREERRRAAVEEKRRQKQEEEKAHYEAVIRRTMERSQRAKQKPNRWSWGGTLSTSASHNNGFLESAVLCPLDLAGLERYHGAFSLARRHGPHCQYADRRSVSTMNLSKHTDPIITKRLSSSSATLLHSPDRALQKRTSLSSSSLVNKAQSRSRVSLERVSRDKATAMRRMPLSPWENTMVNRLQTPTHSYLARSRSAMSLSGEAVTPICPRSASCHPMSSMSFKALQSRSTERPMRAGLNLGRPIRAGYIGTDSTARRKTTHNISADRKDKDYVRKSWSNLSYPTPNPTLSVAKRARSPGNQRSMGTTPSPVRASAKSLQKSPTPKQGRSPPPLLSLTLSSSNPSLSPGNLRPSKAVPESPRETPEGEGPMREESEPNSSPNKPALETPAPKLETTMESVGSPPAARPSAGTTDPEEASRLLTEKRRQAREQREREEEERRQQEEAERRSRDEMARRKAEERAKREEEAQRQAEERRQKEEEERRAEEERAQREREEAERAQKQKEEDEARQREEAERVRQEREKHFQREEAERLERKKRLEEIMKRTRRSDPAEKKTTPQRNGDLDQQNPESTAIVTSDPAVAMVSVSEPQTQEVPAPKHTDSNGPTGPGSPTLPPAGHSASSDTLLRENGVVVVTEPFEEVIEVPIATKLSRQEGDGEEDEEGMMMKAPIQAFRENGSMHPLSGADESPSQQAAAALESE